MSQQLKSVVIIRIFNKILSFLPEMTFFDFPILPFSGFFQWCLQLKHSFSNRRQQTNV